MIRLDLGCGRCCREGHLGVDLLKLSGVRIIASVEALPFKGQIVQHIWCVHVLEHLDLLKGLWEIHRVLAPGGTAEVWLPHATGIGAWSDPTHRRGYTWRTWAYFMGGWYDLPIFIIRWRRLCWRPRGQYPFIDRIINLLPAFFEKYLAPLVGGCHETGALLEKSAAAVRGPMFDNPNLNPGFIKALANKCADTRTDQPIIKGEVLRF